MRKTRLLCLLLIGLLVMQYCLMPVFADETDPTATTEETEAPTATVPATSEDLPSFAGQDASVMGGSRTIEAMSSLQGSQRILNTARSAILYEINSDSIVYSWNPDERMPPYGLNMIVTCLIAMEQCQWDEIVTVNSEIFDFLPELDDSSMDYTYHGIFLISGEEIRLKDLLYSAIVWNANDAAEAIADYVAGSRSAFVEQMNDFAQRIGCKDTLFTDPTGLDFNGQYTTARDMARILREASKNEDFIRVFGETFWDIAETNAYPYRAFMYSDNYMSGMYISDHYYDYRVIGGKVTDTPGGLRSFASLARDGDLCYAIVVLETTPKMEGGEVSVTGNNEFIETQQLVDIGFEGYESKQILKPGQITSYFSVPNGTNDVVAGPDREIVTLLPEGLTLDNLTLRYQKTNGVLTAPVKAGELIDILTVWYGNVCIAQANLITKNGSEVSEKAQLATQDTSDDGMGAGMTVFLVIVGLLVAAAATLYILRALRIRRMRRYRRIRKRNRRRDL